MNHPFQDVPPLGGPVSLSTFLSEALSGLSQVHKTLPCKYFYDEQGSRLFNEICELEEYYPTRTETKILRDHIREITDLIGEEIRLVEFGSGTSTKTRLLLTHLPAISDYVPIDISGTQLSESCTQLAGEFPGLEIRPLEVDYGEVLCLPDPSRKPKRTVAFFPGSTIGNFESEDAIAFMKTVASLCGADGGLLIGIDLRKERRILEPAYNDCRGITARFNLNILARMNRELAADFDLSAFFHHAPYNARLGRIEMRLVSRREQLAHLGGYEFQFGQGECITTEYSYKYTLPGFARLASTAGFEVVKSWEDKNNLFSVLFLRVAEEPAAFEADYRDVGLRVRPNL